ncbi:N-acetylmuramoyl-L-alanine amidase, partial [Streptomyces seoulensis]
MCVGDQEGQGGIGAYGVEMDDGDRRPGRRALLIGGAVAAAGAALLAHDELSRLYWRLPGVER